ncbi:hypothetical protein WAG13_18960, partial [Bacillus cereus]
GDTGVSGSTVNNASFYLSTTTSVATNTSIPFNSQNTLNGTGITNSLGSISLAANTTYCINFTLAVGGGAGFNAGIFFNGTLIPGTTIGQSFGNSTSNGVIFTTGLVVGTLEIRNTGATQNFVGGDCSVRIFQIS